MWCVLLSNTAHNRLFHTQTPSSLSLSFSQKNPELRLLNALASTGYQVHPPPLSIAPPTSQISQNLQSGSRKHKPWQTQRQRSILIRSSTDSSKVSSLSILVCILDRGGDGRWSTMKPCETLALFFISYLAAAHLCHGASFAHRTAPRPPPVGKSILCLS